MKVVTFLILCFAIVALADDFKTVQGKEYKNVTVSRVEPDGIVLKSKSGISRVCWNVTFVFSGRVDQEILCLS